MSNDRYYGTAARSRRSTPVLDGQNNGCFFPAGQGGRTVLPPIASAFPSSRSPVPIEAYSTYSQPQRYSPPRNEYDTGYSQWTSPQPMYYETHHESRQAHHAHSSYPSPVTPTMQLESHEHHCKLQPISPATSCRDDRWDTTLTASHHIRSPTAVYPSPAYPASSNNYVYPTTYDSPNHDRNYSRGSASRNEHRSSSYIASPVNGPAYIPQGASAVAEDGTSIKKKRKRADAQQLKVLNETYNRTAFPSTEERADLARRLDMTARSVQIWFQNKRQSLRQTKSQTSNVSGNQPFVTSPQLDSMSGDIHLHDSMVSSSSNAYTIPRSMQPESASRHHARYDVDSSDSRLKRPSRAGY